MYPRRSETVQDEEMETRTGIVFMQGPTILWTEGREMLRPDVRSPNVTSVVEERRERRRDQDAFIRVARVKFWRCDGGGRGMVRPIVRSRG